MTETASTITAPLRVVPSGSFAVSETKDQVLRAFLGSCVGVSLVDRRAGIGGLMHILLPEPPAGQSVPYPEYYASEGMPVFLKTLLARGARTENMEACIAGGALVGPVDRRDLDLDLGGRSVELVESFLEWNGIPVKKSETSGFFTCSISLDLNSLDTTIEPIGFPAEGSPVERVEPIADGALRLAIENTRPVPQIALKIIRMTREEKHSLGDIGSEVRRDQVLSARVLKLCNSTLFYEKEKVTSIDRAISRLGETRLICNVLAACMEDFFGNGGQGYSLCKGGLFKHSLTTARIGSELANYVKGVPPDVAYTAGLLHDIGKTVLDQHLDRAYPFFYRRTQEEEAELVTVEREAFGITHCAAGALLAARWHLPKTLADVILHHHNPAEARVSPKLVHLVYIADYMSSRFVTGLELERLNPRWLASSLRKIGFSDQHFSLLVERVSSEGIVNIHEN